MEFAKLPSTDVPAPPTKDESRSVRKYRIRTRKACEPCRKRKKKCDGKEPCDICIGYGYTCSYTRRNFERNSSSTFTQPSVSRKSTPSESEYPFRGERLPLGTPYPSSSGSLPVSQSTTFPGGATNIIKSRPHMFEPFKCRFMASHSAVAFPRSLALDLKSKNPLRLHSFAWNACLRPETTKLVHRAIREYVSLEAVMEYGGVYFELIHPIYGVMDREDFYDRALRYWQCQGTEYTETIDFEAVIAGVVALGSFFSMSKPCQAESVLVDFARQVLDLGISHPPASLSNHQPVAWILRTLYLRLTTRPHIAWLSSCLTMHVIEALGLHREIETLDLTVRGFPQPNAADLDKRRRMFWVAWSVNLIVSAESGRSPVHIDSWDVRMIDIRPGDDTIHLVELARIIYETEPKSPNTTEVISINNALIRIKSLPDNRSAFSMLKADVAIHCFRRHRIRILKLLPDDETLMLEIIRAALTEGLSLAEHQQPWWNVISTNFQSICVLLSIDSPDSLALLPEALSTLEKVVNIFNSHLTREALRTALILVESMEERKQEQINTLHGATNQTMRELARSPSPSPTRFLNPTEPNPMFEQDLSMFEFSTDNNAVWAQFFDADSMMDNMGGSAIIP
ncbi:MAG: hypothetical protein M1834_006243 [Cirrosporium novae-zelandiae]|nr:MAG: hypothetical protein M1834_006243 [Cirrosporium novae-zelandiae]